MNTKILDCTLRDGGYYTNWDFNHDLVDTYIKAVNELPIDIIEIGYRSLPQKEYLGEYFYCPQYVLDHITSTCTKEVAVMFNEKDVRPEMLNELLDGCDRVAIIRLAIDPANFERALILARDIKSRGFQVALNVMYMSKWDMYPDFLNLVSEIKTEDADYLNMVDSFGGVYPNDVKRISEDLRTRTNIPIGFHGHNNLELGLINSLTALESGAQIIDATITGMGRGAGNLKTELLLTALNSKQGLEVDFNVLGKVVGEFEALGKIYNWGTNLPYMIAGANTFPQKQVMNWVTNRFYSFNSIIRTLQNKKEGRKDNYKLAVLQSDKIASRALIIGGGPSAIKHSSAILEYLKLHPGIPVIHASSKNAQPYAHIPNPQFFCLVGNEGHRLEDSFLDMDAFKGKCVLPPYPRKMGTYIPKILENNAVELGHVTFTNVLSDTHTTIALQIAIDLGAQTVYVVGYDGYPDNLSRRERELTKENEYLFEAASKHLKIKSILPTEYELEVESLYALLTKKEDS